MTRSPLALAWISLGLLLSLVVVGSLRSTGYAMPVHINAFPEERFTSGGLSARLDMSAAMVIPKQVPAAAIAVNDKDVVALTTAQEAQRVLDSLKDWYQSTALQGAQKVEKVDFSEAVAIRSTTVPATGIRTVEEAMSILRLGTDKAVSYTVASGDTMWDIASKYGTDVDRLGKSNPTVKAETLQVGDKLVITTKEPYVHFAGVEVVSQKEGTPFTEKVKEDPNLWPWQVKIEVPGVYGQKQIAYRISKQDNQEVTREVLSTQVLSQPVTQVRVQGTRQTPSLGTGKYFWPVLGPITSYFGPRWGSWHTGVDIGVPDGTPIKAADVGMVVAVGWDGGYGKAVKVDHGGGKIVTLYAHLRSYAVSVGDTVKKGEVVGYSGNTGNSTGPHLHFEIRVDGTAKNPLDFYPAQ